MISDPTKTKKLRSIVIGAGPAGLIAAEKLARSGHDVSLFDRMPSIGRKFLMAGRGGLNLTHSEPLPNFLSRYAPRAPALTEAIRAFPPEALRDFVHGLGQQTFVGSSGRVFPKVMKASPLLRAWITRLKDLGVAFHLRHDWQGWDDNGGVLFVTPEGPRSFDNDAVLLALGGASWPKLGSDGGWARHLPEIAIAPFEPANAGLRVAWSDRMREHAGKPLKRLVARIGEREAEGEAIITATGLEGGIIYALCRAARLQLAREGSAEIVLDLKPDFRPEWIAQRLSEGRKGDSLSSRLRKAAGLQPQAVTLLHEAALNQGQRLADLSPAALGQLVHAVPLPVAGVTGLERAISTTGGIRFSEINADFMLTRKPGVFVAGEMLDWEAPTGGYLLQACFSTGLAAAEGMVRFLSAPP